MSEDVINQARGAHQAARLLGGIDTKQKNRALDMIAWDLVANVDSILVANRQDIDTACANGISSTLIERLTLSRKRIEAMAEGVLQVAALVDPVGHILDCQVRPNGLKLTRVRVPLGVIGIIYESRPNVTVDSTALCLKSGNAVILRGGSEAIHSNRCLASLLQTSAERAGLPANSVQMVNSTDRAASIALMQAEGLVDLLIPRGGVGLKKTVLENARVPVLTSLGGVCHTYVDSDADIEMAVEIAVNAKVSRPSVCNAMETLLVHRSIATELLPTLALRLTAAGVELRGCEATCLICPQAVAATTEDWSTEYLDLILSIRVVESLDEALEHISEYGTGHSEAIVTNDRANANRFTREVDAACVYVNASTRFTDGFEFGLGAEVGISTQKMHARGPIGLAELTTYKTIIEGSGQIRV